MRFRLIDAAKKDIPVQRLCTVLGVSRAVAPLGRIVRSAIGSAPAWRTIFQKRAEANVASCRHIDEVCDPVRRHFRTRLHQPASARNTGRMETEDLLHSSWASPAWTCSSVAEWWGAELREVLSLL